MGGGLCVFSPTSKTMNHSPNTDRSPFFIKRGGRISFVKMKVRERRGMKERKREAKEITRKELGEESGEPLWDYLRRTAGA